MRSREEVVQFIAGQFDTGTTREKGDKCHYGLQELRELVDFIYGSPPMNREQELNVDTHGSSCSLE